MRLSQDFSTNLITSLDGDYSYTQQDAVLTSEIIQVSFICGKKDSADLELY